MEEMMKRPLFLGVAVLALLGAMGYGLFWQMQTCHSLDRFFGISGCAQVVRIADFHPLQKAAISAPDADGVVSIFGQQHLDDAWMSALVRLDLDDGTELIRYPLTYFDGYGQLIFAADNERAVLVCNTAGDCVGNGYNAAIISVKDGSVQEYRRKADDDLVYFPGDPRPSFGEPWVQIYVAGGERILNVERDDSVRLLDAAGQQISTLFEGRRNDILRSGVSVSPSGNRVALFDYARHGIPARLYVWDALTGAALVERDLGNSYRWRVTPTWTVDETALTLVRQDGRDTLLELYRVP